MLSDDDQHLLPQFYAVQRLESTLRRMHHVRFAEQLFRFLFRDLPRTGRALGRAELLVFFQLAQLIHQAVGCVLHVLHHTVGLLPRSGQFFLALPDKRSTFFLGLLQCMRGRVLQALYLVLLRLQLHLQILKLVEDIVKLLVLVGQMRPGVLNDLRRKAKLLADEERVGFSRYAHRKAVGWAQRFHIEFAGGVLHARRIQRKNFQL